MSQSVNVWEETVEIPTYLVGKQERLALFLEQRVYQGSSGSVYPYGVIDTLSDEKVSQKYNAVYLENDFLKIMILPELGGRVHQAYDKVMERDFVYHNEVIKPALVGLLGPWISGGIEFNWPQHHRPTTFMHVDHKIQETGGKKTVWVGEIEPMRGLQVMTGFTLYQDCSFLEIQGKIYNPNPTPRSFLWWANPAVKGGEHHQSVFPPDVTAVVDHGRREVSTFPIATGNYYKIDYSDGVDISQWRNVPVPTSYMVDKSEFNFFGSYDYAERGGLLHVADNHISPGKKMWTWGNGEFGLAWERNLTDSNGPYVELMAGVYADNQPDFTWLNAYEEKEFFQYFMPYNTLGIVQNANTSAALKLELKNGKVTWGVYAVSQLKQHRFLVKCENETIFDRLIDLNCGQAIMDTFAYSGSPELVSFLENWATGQTVLKYAISRNKIHEIPEPAKPPLKATEINSADECWFIGQHLQQYNHATRLPNDYYLKGIELDHFDYRCNLAMAEIEFDRFNFQLTIDYCTRALNRANQLNKNPRCGCASFLRGCAYEKIRNYSEAFDDFYKSAWSANTRSSGFFGLARISTRNRCFAEALRFCELGLSSNETNYQLIALKAFLLQLTGKNSESLKFIKNNIERHPLLYILYYLQFRVTQSEQNLQELIKITETGNVNSVSIANFFVESGFELIAIEVLKLLKSTETSPKYLLASLSKSTVSEEVYSQMIKDARDSFEKNILFPNSLSEAAALESIDECYFAKYLLGCFHYSKRNYSTAYHLWMACVKMKPDFAEVWRCLAIHAFNKLRQQELGVSYLRKAFELSSTNARLLFELDQALKITKTLPVNRLSLLENHLNIVEKRDDLTIELISLYNMTSQLDKAAKLLEERKFHPWEGGEGKVTSQFLINLQLRALDLLHKGKINEAESALKSALNYPENLSEGRLHQQTDNDIHYWLGICAQRRNDKNAAEKYWNKAIRGQNAFESSKYYNDQPIDYQLYRGLAMKKLGNITESNELFGRWLSWSEQRLKDEVETDFFAVSLPNQSVLEIDEQEDHFMGHLFSKALAILGCGVKENLIEFQKLDPNHSKANFLLKLQNELIF